MSRHVLKNVMFKVQMIKAIMRIIINVIMINEFRWSNQMIKAEKILLFVVVPVISVGNTCSVSTALMILQSMPFFKELLQLGNTDGRSTVIHLIKEIWHGALKSNDFVRYHFIVQCSKGRTF
jgi:hypothetical protein